VSVGLHGYIIIYRVVWQRQGIWHLERHFSTCVMSPAGWHLIHMCIISNNFVLLSRVIAKQNCSTIGHHTHRRTHTKTIPATNLEHLLGYTYFPQETSHYVKFPKHRAPLHSSSVSYLSVFISHEEEVTDSENHKLRSSLYNNKCPSIPISWLILSETLADVYREYRTPEYSIVLPLWEFRNWEQWEKEIYILLHGLFIVCVYM